MFLRLGYRPTDAAGVLAGGSRRLHVTFDDAFVSIDRVAPVLERLGVQTTVFACAALADGGLPLDIPELAADAAAFPRELQTMTWDELRALRQRAGFEIASHTLTHPHLPQLSDEELARELRDSRARIADELGACRYLAYPFGEEDARVNEAARDAGYTAAFGLPGDASGANAMSVPRVGVYRKDNKLRLAAKASPALRRAVETLRR